MDTGVKGPLFVAFWDAVRAHDVLIVVGLDGTACAYHLTPGLAVVEMAGTTTIQR